MEERGEMFARAMVLANEDSSRVWIIDQISFSPQVANLEVTYDLAGGVAGAALWPYTIRFTGEEGGVVAGRSPASWSSPGTRSVAPTGSMIRPRSAPLPTTGTMADPYTGLAWPQHVESATVTVGDRPADRQDPRLGRPEVRRLHRRPGRCLGSWDAVNQSLRPGGEGVTRQIKVTVTYPADLFETVTWHDGSPLTIG